MHRKMKLIFPALLALVLLPSMGWSGDKESVLRRLDTAAANFRTASAEFEFDTFVKEPIPETDRQKGVVYYERKSGKFRMAAHILEVNGKKAPKTYAYSGGAIQLYEPMID